MDRMIHTALNTLKNLTSNRSVRAQNMSNINVPGHRKDLNTNFTSGFLHQVNQYDTRVFAIHDGANGFSNKQGGMPETGSRKPRNKRSFSLNSVGCEAST